MRLFGNLLLTMLGAFVMAWVVQTWTGSVALTFTLVGLFGLVQGWRASRRIHG